MQRYKIIYSPFVNSQLLDIYHYLISKWGLRSTASFLNKYEITVQQLSSNPKAGRVSLADKRIRSILITKHNRLYYEIEEETITLLQIFDTRQDPEKNKFG